MGILLLIDILNIIVFAGHFIAVYQSHQGTEFSPFRHDVFVLALLNGVNNIWILIQFLYFGVIKRGLETETTEIIVEIE